MWIRNSKGQYLISQRSANRPTYPLMWECVGGSVVKGEDSLQGAIREAVSYTHLRAHETDSYLVCRLLLEKKKN